MTSFKSAAQFGGDFDKSVRVSLELHMYDERTQNGTIHTIIVGYLYLQCDKILGMNSSKVGNGNMPVVLSHQQGVYSKQYLSCICHADDCDNTQDDAAELLQSVVFRRRHSEKRV